jgi:hypothetical protein
MAQPYKKLAMTPNKPSDYIKTLYIFFDLKLNAFLQVNIQPTAPSNNAGKAADPVKPQIHLQDSALTRKSL